MRLPDVTSWHNYLRRHYITVVPNNLCAVSPTLNIICTLACRSGNLSTSISCRVDSASRVDTRLTTTMKQQLSVAKKKQTLCPVKHFLSHCTAFYKLVDVLTQVLSKVPSLTTTLAWCNAHVGTTANVYKGSIIPVSPIGGDHPAKDAAITLQVPQDLLESTIGL